MSCLALEITAPMAVSVFHVLFNLNFLKLVESQCRCTNNITRFPPSPAKITWSVRSMTNRDSEIGCCTATPGQWLERRMLFTIAAWESCSGWFDLDMQLCITRLWGSWKCTCSSGNSHKKNHSQIRAPRHKVNCVFFSFPAAAVSAMANVNLCAAACHSTSSQRRALHDHRVQLGVPVSIQGTTCFSVKRMWAFARNGCRVIPFALLLPVRFFWGDTFPNAIRRRTTRRRKKHQLCLHMAPSFFMWMFAAWHAWCF